ncbi:glycosyltransferase family 2 protein, partial [Steroidobacter cummioxidans]|uniref:glycosyltransferase family 2 protein n=1 Tax=Steroidobacter cummioxidans TaxID=1803913 RepID=UPI0032E42ECF
MTLLVMTHNEAEKIGRCLDSVTFVAEKLVIDCGSSDATVEIAKTHGARVVHQDWLGFGKQRNFGATQAAHDWILYLDADEYLSAELVGEMMRHLPALLASESAGATLVRASWFMGAPMRWYRPMAREKITRLYHRRRARWRDVRVHESLEFTGHVTRFRAPVYHDHNPTLVHRQCKLLRYACLLYTSDAA